MPRDPRQIQLEIDAARESLAATLDQIAYRSSPTRLKAQGRDAVQRFLQTPAGQATMGAVGLLATLVVVQKVRHRRSARRGVGRREVGRRETGRRETGRRDVMVEKVHYRKR